MDELEGEALSEAVAKAYEIEVQGPVLNKSKKGYVSFSMRPLHEDSIRCFELSIDYAIEFSKEDWRVQASHHIKTPTIVGNMPGFIESFEQAEAEIVDDNSYQAARTAILRCLLKMKKESK